MRICTGYSNIHGFNSLVDWLGRMEVRCFCFNSALEVSDSDSYMHVFVILHPFVILWFNFSAFAVALHHS